MGVCTAALNVSENFLLDFSPNCRFNDFNFLMS